ncbi:hypothetical protein Btru_001917 [Bulinus truncatus]|nr:hypothetical protein Btru_001917 [Bulinus truncatus]
MRHVTKWISPDTMTANDHSSDYIIQKLARHPSSGYSSLTLLTRSLWPSVRNLQEELRDSTVDDDSEMDKADNKDSSDILEMFRPALKRSLGSCINNCMTVNRAMNFIKCKTMCH